MAKLNKIVIVIFLFVLICPAIRAASINPGVIFQTNNNVSYYTNTTYNFTNISVYPDSLFIDGGNITAYSVSDANITLDTLGQINHFNFSTNVTLTNLTLEHGFADFSVTNGIKYTLRIVSGDVYQSIIASGGELGYTDILTNIYYIYKDMVNFTSPTITIINNSKTRDAATTKIFLNNSEAITFYVLSDQEVTNWSWYSDNIIQSNNFDEFTINFSSGRYHYVKVNATNSFGSSNTLTWGVNVFPAMATATIGALNETPANEIRNALENKDAPALVMATALPFTNLIGAFFYAIVWFIVFVMMWIKQKSMNIPMVIGIIFGGLIISFLPEQYQLVATALIVLGIFGIIYIFFRGRG